jgi:hypothetical protein
VLKRARCLFPGHDDLARRDGRRRLGFFGVNAGGREERSERAAGEQGVKSGQVRSLPVAGRLVTQTVMRVNLIIMREYSGFWQY